MKTMDEVIKAWSICFSDNSRSNCTGCPYADEDGEAACFNHDREDALHYLKEYRDRKETLRSWTEKAISEQQNLSDAITFMQAYRDDKDDLTALRAYWAEQQANPPLTWDELKQMEGKPIWVEYNFQISNKEFRDNSKRWCIIREFKPWHDTEIIITENGFVLSKNEQVTDWQAYRKER